MKTLACYNMKGGVGKTTTAVNLSYLYAANGFRTLLWDLDPQGAATFHLGVETLQDTKLKKIVKDKKMIKSLVEPTPYPNLSIIPAGFEYRNMDLVLDDSKKSKKKMGKILSSFTDEYDVFVFDCPPSISNLSDAVFSVSDYILMPLVPAVLSQQTFLKVSEYLAGIPDTTAQIIPFFNMVDRRKSGHRMMILQSKKQFPGVFCDNSIPARANVERMGVERLPLFAYDPKSDAAVSFGALWRELERRTVSGGESSQPG
ncbi:AAA family ATPase [Maridesulfovibrio sp.]|uniref:ParA family protein n=1 Tax=Maridesulfovibrio sp. TaxID=2795000 RepID=UPI002A18D084|nr:AAA family ATPase [Maridesulfovibrio sp.]